MTSRKHIKVITIFNDGSSASQFGEQSFELNGEPLRMLSDQQNAENFRVRTSSPGYESGWHTAGDPTLLLIMAGSVEIILRDDSTATFHAGDMFIAQDYLNDGIKQNESHGHRARVIGNHDLMAIHIKLRKR